MWYMHMLMWYIHICSCGTYTYAHVVHTHMLRWYIHMCSGGTYTYAPDHIGDAPDHIVVMSCFMCKCSRPHLVCSRPHRRCSCSYAPTQMHHIHICSCGTSTCSRPQPHMLPTTSPYAVGSMWICSSVDWHGIGGITRFRLLHCQDVRDPLDDDLDVELAILVLL